MDRETFEDILTKMNAVMPEEGKSIQMTKLSAKDGKGTSLCNRIKLLASIRYLAGGMRWDICFALNIGFGSFFVDTPRGVLWPTLMALDAIPEFSIGLDLQNEGDCVCPVY